MLVPKRISQPSTVAIPTPPINMSPDLGGPGLDPSPERTAPWQKPVGAYVNPTKKENAGHILCPPVVLGQNIGTLNGTQDKWKLEMTKTFAVSWLHFEPPSSGSPGGPGLFSSSSMLPSLDTAAPERARRYLGHGTGSKGRGGELRRWGRGLGVKETPFQVGGGPSGRPCETVPSCVHGTCFQPTPSFRPRIRKKKNGALLHAPPIPKKRKGMSALPPLSK